MSRALSLLLLLLLPAVLLPAPQAAAQRFRPVERLEVVDSRQTVVGLFLPLLPSQVGVGRPTLAEGVVPFQVPGRRLVLLRLHNNRLLGTQDALFATSDCLGTPFLLATTPEATATAPPGRTVYLQDLTAPPSRLEVRSHRTHADAPCARAFASQEVRPGLALVDLDTLFTRPVRVRARRALP